MEYELLTNNMKNKFKIKTFKEENGNQEIPVSMRMEASGKLNLLTSKYFIHLASLMHPLSSCRDRLYDTAHITARLRPWTDGGGPGGGAWLYGDGGAWRWEDEEDCGGCGGGRDRGSATRVTALHTAQRIF